MTVPALAAWALGVIVYIESVMVIALILHVRSLRAELDDRIADLDCWHKDFAEERLRTARRQD